MSKFSGRACPRTPLEHISASCGVQKFLQKIAAPPRPPRPAIAGSATVQCRDKTLVCRRQILTTKVDPRAVRANVINATVKYIKTLLPYRQPMGVNPVQITNH